MGNLRGSEWLILALVVILLFGAKKLPEAARGLGRSLRIFKSEIKQPETDEVVDASGSTAVTPATAAIVQAPVLPVPAPAPTYVPAQAAPIPAAPLATPTATVADETSVQSVNERFYGQEKSAS